MKPFASALYLGSVIHRRLRPRQHKLRYRIFSMLLDLDELGTLDRSVRFFSHNRFNLFSFHDGDHGVGAAKPLRAHITSVLNDAGIPIGDGAIRLLCMPRILGYGFNPLSVYFCHRPNGELAAVLYEVSNTFGERHNYLIPVTDPAAPVILQSSPKRLHVSPFLPLSLDYRFRIAPPDKTVSVTVHVSDANGLLVAASQTAERRELNSGNLLKVFFAYPLLTVKVVAGIHWEALRLWLKGVRLYTKPPAPETTVTLGSPRH